MAKVADAMDRALLRRHSASKAAAVAPPPEKSSPWKTVIIIGLVALFAFGAWSWYTDDTESDLDKLAAEISNTEAKEDPQAERRMRRYLVRFGIAIAAFAVGYMRLKSSLSP